MSVRESFMLVFWGQGYRRRGIELDYGNDGFPCELWVSATNKDYQRNVRAILENSVVNARFAVLRRL